MPFNIQTFKTRALTAVIFVLVMLCGLLVNEWTFFALFSIIHFGCWIEYIKIMGLIHPSYKKINLIHQYAAMLAGWAFMCWMSGSIFDFGGHDLHKIFFWAMIVLFAIMIFSQLFISIKNTDFSILGLLYISLSWGLMMNLRTAYTQSFFVNIGLLIPCVLIASIWINDTMAYIVGSFIGKHSLSSISPNKTWEGTVGGALLAIATVSSVGYYALGLHDWKSLIAISAIAAIAGTFGDLIESKLKRMAGIKDSGRIMPGHGGFLDRFDSLVFATPFVWIYVHFFT